MNSHSPPLDPSRDEPLAYRLNKAKVLNLVQKTENASRADIAKLSGLSAPTVSRIVEALIEQGLVREMSVGAPQGGRCHRRAHRFSSRQKKRIHGVGKAVSGPSNAAGRRPIQRDKGCMRRESRKRYGRRVLGSRNRQSDKSGQP